MTAICETFGEYFTCSDVWTDDRAEGRGYVTHKPSDDRYGHLSNSDSNTTIRLKMIGLFAGLPFLGTLRLAFRVIHCTTGRWIWSKAYPEASLEWKTRRIEMYLQNSSDPLPTRLDLCKQIAAKSLASFVETIAKTLTFPVAILLEMGVSLLGIVSPLAGRRLFSQLEQKWSISSHSASRFHLEMNFNAPCMQPKLIWEELNFYRFSKSEKSSSNYDEICSLRQMINRHAAYFPETTQIWQNDLRTLITISKEKLPLAAQIKQQLQNFLDESDRMVEGASFNREESLKNLTDLMNELISHDPV